MRDTTKPWWGPLGSPYVLLVLTYVCWAGNTVFARGVAGEVPPMHLSFWRWTVALLVLLPFGWRAMWAQRAIYREYAWRLLFISITGITAFNSLIYHAVQFTTAIHASLLTATIPAAGVVLSYLVYRDTINMRTALGMVAAFVGVVVIIGHGGVGVLLGLAFNKGDLLALGAVIAWAAYSVALKGMPKTLDSIGFLLATMIIGLLFITPLYLREVFAGETMVVSLGNVVGIVYLSVFASVLGFVFFTKGLAMVGPNVANQFNYLSPVFSGALAILLLGEQLEWFHVAGLVLILFGVWCATSRRAVKAAPPEAA